MAKKRAETASTINVAEHVLVPKHELCPEETKKKILSVYKAAEHQFPKIRVTDPGIQHLSAKEGDLIKVTRPSRTAGETVFYRIVSME